jgi:hypothetical protein
VAATKLARADIRRREGALHFNLRREKEIWFNWIFRE